MADNRDTDELSAALGALSTKPADEEVKQEKPAPPKKEKAKGEKTIAAGKPKTEGSSPFDRWTLLPSDSINYGHFSGGDKEKKKVGGGESFYITTAINYTNGPAHMGHAYEATTTDALARFKRVCLGEDKCYFVTGTDEHGQKIATTAAADGKEPIDLCNKYATGFQVLNQRILVSNNDFIRTTSDRHKRTAHELWKRCDANGDIYLDTYSGWYNVREEAFVTDSEAALSDYKDPTSGLPLKQVEEASYFFKMSAYHDKLVQHIQDNPEFIQPQSHRNQILTRLGADRLRDLSISRTSFSWGIPVPEGFDSKHVMYVWFDALTNYVTGVDALGANDPSGSSPNKDLASFWPANVHIIGKDILWFHTVIWPCILMSGNVPLPKTVFAHGFVNDKEGKKMSKSMGNVVDPHDMLDKYPVDTFRWYLCKAAPYGGELAFSETSLMEMHNADLCDTLGNLIHRATNLCGKFCGGVVPDVPSPPELPADFKKYREEYMKKMNNFELEGGASIAMQAYRDVNGFLTDKAPWHMKGDDLAEERQIVVRATLEAVYALAHFLTPFLPNGSAQIFQKLNTPPSTLMNLSADLRNLSPGTKVDVGDVLYSKLGEERSDEAGASKKAMSYAEAQKRKKEKKAKEIAASRAGAKAAGNADQPDFTKIDIRVGKITKVWNHPDADKLFCEEIDVGEESGPREIASGLREHYTLEDLQDRKVLVVCNLKTSKILGFTSNGMVLAAKGDGKVELVSPPPEAKVGERVYIEGITGDAVSSTQVKKKKIWEAVAKDLKTAEGGVATWNGKQITTSAGVCSAHSLVGVPIS